MSTNFDNNTIESVQQKFQIENITVVRPPLLKAYYWEYFDIDGFNSKLDSDKNAVHHTMLIETRDVNSTPLKVIFWLRNTSSHTIRLRLRRIKNCNCIPKQTRVGFNQYRQLYHCPHRRLIHILQDDICICMNPGDLVAMTMVVYFYLIGEHKLTYEISCSNSRVVTLDFQMNIICFDPLKCIITKELIPVDLKEHRRFVQPIWVRNMTMQQLNFVFSSNNSGLKMINPKITVPRQSIWPLMVEYRPNDCENKLDLTLNLNSIHKNFQVDCKGIIGSSVNTNANIPETKLPTEDIECVDFPYIIYPSILTFNSVEPKEERSLMVSVHNYDSTCREFRWQSYVINDLFEITFEPANFRLKPHRSKLCVVKLRVHDSPLHFKRIPLVLEVHRIFNKSTSLAKSLLEEVESIDNPKWSEDSYLMHVLLHLDLQVNFKKEKEVALDSESESPNKNQTNTIFEKLFWEYLSNSNHMRENKNPEISDNLTYDEVLQLHKEPLQQPDKLLEIDRNTVLKIISQLIATGLAQVARDHIFLTGTETVEETPPAECQLLLEKSNERRYLF